MNVFLHAPQFTSRKLPSTAILLVLSFFVSISKLGAQQSALANNTYTPLVSSTAANFTNSSSQSLGVDHFSPLGNLTNTNTADAATWTSLIAVGSIQRWVQVEDNRAASDPYLAGDYAGFAFTSASLLGALSTTTVTVQTYRNGSIAGASSGPIALSSLVKLANADQVRVGYISTADFDAIRITFDISGLGVAPSISVHYAEVAKFAAGASLVCNTNTVMNLPTYPMSVGSTVNTAVSLVNLLGGISNVDAIVSSATSDFATIDASLGVLNDSVTISVKDQVTDYTNPTFAGFDIETANLLSLGVGTAGNISIRAYLNGVLVDQATSSNLVIGADLISGGRRTIGFVPSGTFDEVRITLKSGVILGASLGLTRVYGAVFKKFCAGPALACNTKTAMNLPTYPMTASTSVKGVVATMIGGIANVDNVFSASTSDFATINPSVGVIGDSITLAVKDNVTNYPYPTFVGFDISSADLANLSLAGNMSISAYKDGVLVSTATGGTLLVGASVLTGSTRQTIGFVPPGDVDEVRLNLKSGSIATITLGATNVYSAVFRSFCEGTALDCNTLTILDESNYPIYINAEHTGVSNGLLGANNNVQNASKAIDNDPNSYATANVLVAGLDSVSLAVKKELSNFASGTFAGFEIANPSTLLTVDLLNDIRIITYLDGIKQESKSGSNALLSVSSSLLGSGYSRRVVGFVTSLPYDEVVISLRNTVGANTGETRIYSFYSQRFCTGTINCNGTYWLNSGPPPTGYPVIINGQRTGTSGLACVTVTGVELNNPQNVISTSTTDYATIKMGVNVLCPVSISVEDVLTTYPSGTIAGFAIRNMSSLVELDLFNSITIQTWKDGVFQESATGVGLLKLELLGSPILGGGAGTYNVGFKTTKPFDEVRISFNALVNVDPLPEVRVYGAYVDTRYVTTSDGSQSLTCLVPSLTPANPGILCQGSSVLLTAAPAGATTYTWYKDSVVIGGATSQTYSANASGFYTVTVNATGYSGAMSNAVVVTVIDCTPVAEPDNNATPKGVAVNGDISVNDSDPRNLPLTYNTTPVQNPAHGTVTINANGTYTYTPNSTYVGIDSFTYQVCNTSAQCTTAKAYISVVSTNIGNDAPIAADDYPATKLNTAINSTVATNDIDPEKNPLTFSLTGTAQNGSINMNPDGSFTYTPNNGFIGTEAIPYQVCDNGTPSLCDNAVIYITISPNNNGPANDPPIAVNDINLTAPGIAVSGTVASNDTDPNANPLSFTLVGALPPGLVFNSDGSYTYTPAGNFIGTLNVVYSVCDNGTPSLCDTATLSIVSSATLLPDLTPSITVAPNVMNGVTSFYLTVKVSEINNVSTNGTITVIIPKDSRVSFTYQSSLTTVGSTPVNNTNWTYNGSNAFFHVFTSNTVISAGAFSTFGVVASFNPMNAKGNYTLTSTIESGSGGEIKTSNNSDAEIANYFPGN